jgi:hypothetical protein
MAALLEFSAEANQEAIEALGAVVHLGRAKLTRTLCGRTAHEVIAEVIARLSQLPAGSPDTE